MLELEVIMDVFIVPAKWPSAKRPPQCPLKDRDDQVSMPARLSKRQQRELEELTHADEIVRAKESSGDEDVRFTSAPGRSTFAALLNEDAGSLEVESASDEPTVSPKAKKKAKKKKRGHSAPAHDISTAEQADISAEPPIVLEARNYSWDPAHFFANTGHHIKKGMESTEEAESKGEKGRKRYRDTRFTNSDDSKRSEIPSRTHQEECYKLLSVSLSHLNPDVEMRRFFGAKVVSASKNEPGSSSKARRQPTTQRSNLTRPRSNWSPAKLREGLTLRFLTDDEITTKAALSPWSNNEKYWTAEYSKRYKGATHAFMQTVHSGDPEGFYAILRNVPWHADTLLQLAELYSHREEHGQAADFIERSLFTYERAFVGAFTFTNGMNRLDFDRVENRPFFLALHKQVIDLQRRGIYRTAFEFARLLLSLDPWSDPHGAYLHLDYLAIKSGMHSWLLSLSELFAPVVSKSLGHSPELEECRSSETTICALPGWAYARALALRADGDRAPQSTESLRQAVLNFPSIVPLLADKAEIELSAEVRSHPAFRIYTRHDSGLAEESLLNLLSNIYVQRSHSLWKDPTRSTWFAETVTELVQTGQLPPKATATPGFSRLRNLLRRSEDFDISIYRHVVVLGAPAQSLLSMIPAHIINGNSLACDPLPPPSSKSQYDVEFFRGAEDVFASTIHRHRNAAQTQRLLERLVPDPVFRRQLQDFFAAHPRLLQQFPGGVVQFAQLAGNMPEEVLQDIMLNAQMMEEAAVQGAAPHGEMPGGMPGDNFVQLDFLEEADVEGEGLRAAEVGGGMPVAHEGPLAPEGDMSEEDEEDEEEIAPLPIRVLRNLVGRFWGVSHGEEEVGLRETLSPNPNTGFCALTIHLPHYTVFLAGLRVTRIPISHVVNLDLHLSMRGGGASSIDPHSLPGPGPAKKRKYNPGSQRHWDDPEQQSNALPYDDEGVGSEIEDDAAEEVADDDAEEEEESRELTHNEIWDDSALIAAWESATAEYEAYHGKGKGWKRDPPVKRSPLWYNVPPNPSELKKSKSAKKSKSVEVAREPHIAQQDPENSLPLDFDTFVPNHDPSLLQASQSTFETQNVPLAPGEHVSRDEAFNRALGAMYWTGYWTAVYHSHQQSNGEGKAAISLHVSQGEDEDVEEEEACTSSTTAGYSSWIGNWQLPDVVMSKIYARHESQLKKRVKLDATSYNVHRYKDGADVQRCLQVQTQDGLFEALTALRNQLTIKFDEGPLQPQDERLTLARSWLESAPGAQSIFSIWEKTTERQMSLLTLLVSVLSSLLTVLSSQFAHHKLVKSLFLEQRQDILRSIFTGLDQDPYSLARKVLEVSWTGIWLDPRVKRTLKVNVFNGASLHHIMKLYNRSVGEDSDEQVPADLAHHFLLAICTHPGVGPAHSGNDEIAPKNARIYNKILAQLLKTLKANEDPRQQELALRIFSACPELVSGYWSAASLTLEPRLSSKWIANIAFFGNVISLPVPEASFFLPGSSLYVPTPPPLTAFLENVFPSVNTKAHFSRGLQSTSPLVQHCTALALAKSLSKYSEVLRIMRKVEGVLEEDENSGQWRKRRIELEHEARRRVPDFQVVIAFSQKAGDAVQSLPKDADAGTTPISKMRATMLAESSTRFWKLLQNSFEVVGTGSVIGPTSGLDTLRRLHVLRLLKESDQFLWSSKSGPRSYINILLSAYSSIDALAIRNAIGLLLRHILAGSILFEHDPVEVYSWLSSLPISVRSPDAEAPDGTPLLNEQSATISFLDDCIQLCLKAPYGYIEVLTATSSNTVTYGDYQGGGSAPSPLLATIVEQIFARIAAGLSPSDTLAIVSFARRLLVRLSGKQGSLELLIRLSERLASLSIDDSLMKKYGIVGKAVEREVEILTNYLFLLDNAAAPMVPRGNSSSAVAEFLDRVESIPIPTSTALRQRSAFELMDCVRLFNSPLQKEEAMRLIATMSHIHRPAVAALLACLDPGQRLLQDPPFLMVLRRMQLKVPFDWAFIQCGQEQLSKTEYRVLLNNAVFDDSQPLLGARAALNIIGHRLLSQKKNASIDSGVLLLIADIMKTGRSILDAADFKCLKEHLFGMPSVNAVLTSSGISQEVIEQGIRPILEAVQGPSDIVDHDLLSPFCSHWAQISLSTSRFTNHDQIILWLPYMACEEVLSILDQALLDFRAIEKGEGIKDVLQAVFSAIDQYINTDGDIPGFRSRLPQLVSLYSAQPDWPLLEGLITRAVDSALTAWIDGVPHDASVSSALEPLVLKSCSRWSKRLELRDEGFDSSVFFERPEWTLHTVTTIKSLIYASSVARNVSLAFLESRECLNQQALHLAPLIWSRLDAEDSHVIGSSGTWRRHFNNLTTNMIDARIHWNHRVTCRRAIQAMLEKLSSLRLELLSDLLATVTGIPADTLTAETLQLGKHLMDMLPQEGNAFASALLEHALRWILRSLAAPDSLDERTITALASLVKCFPNIKPRLTDAVLTVLIQNRLFDVGALTLAVDLTSATNLKAGRSVIQHSDFYKHTEISSASRDAVICLVHALFFKHPQNTCQPSHVLPLTPIYRGTLSTSDRQLLNIFCCFEETKKVSAASLLTRSVSGEENPLDALLGLDSATVFRSCMAFPSWRKLDNLGHDLNTNHPLDDRLYDPVFIALLLAHVLAIRQPSSATQWVQLFRTNVVSLLIRSFSSRNDLLRDTCVSQIGIIMNILQNIDMQEKPHVLYILHLLKDTLKEFPEEGAPPRLPSFSTLLLSHALRGVFYPENFIYPLTARFLLQRPELDISDVPMLYAMLYSTSDDWRKERSWILKFISDAMLSTGEEEWKVFRRRHTWDLLASLFQSARQDRSRGTKSLRHPADYYSLILKSGLLSWIEMMLLDPREDESSLWMRVLENILDVVDSVKFESSTGGEWRAAIGRCMTLLQGDTSAHVILSATIQTNCLLASASFLETLQLKSRIVTKLSLLPGPAVPTLDVLLSQCLVNLRHLEKEVTLPALPFSPRTPAQSRHTSYGPCEGGTAGAHVIWGEVVVGLWRASMTSGSSRNAWDELTPRILIWNVLVDGEDRVAEWARREVVRNMTTQNV
ncbi:transcriptional repressor TCF25-domain-containing protein [Multifurca ochricompacta]|uniref:Transcriptional repressor TCF25-domain-containing protein n=1 Tax=Multifurca ochricompacta TaxID=376703 RepID=A0AAD4M4S6_9AGAM|nr:transcriptional repressor TCF25-domain-containing protein [Multifurca ochricompacta]